MNRYAEIFEKITKDERYLQNLSWGQPRDGHPEGTVEAHIAELEGNLKRLNLDPSSEDYWKLKILIHVHDSFKAEASNKVAITDPRSHASIAAMFLQRHCDDADLISMVQYHDEPYALWRQSREKGSLSGKRLQSLIGTIRDWRLFFRFIAIDGATAGKSREPLEWAVTNIGPLVGEAEDAQHILELL